MFWSKTWQDGKHQQCRIPASCFIQGTCRIMIFVYKVPMLFKFGSVMAHKEKNNEQEH